MEVPFEHKPLPPAEDNGADYWVDRLGVSGEQKRRILNSPFVLIPSIGNERVGSQYFPEGTERFLAYLRKEAGESAGIEICTTDSDYKELGLHHDAVTLPTILITHVVLPLAVSLIGGYIKQFLMPASRSPVVRMRLMVKDRSGEIKAVEFQGPASTFEKSIGEVLNTLVEEQHSEPGES